MNRYKTADIARAIGIQVNTVRLYEKYQLISRPERLANGYRTFTDLHMEQFKLARAALRVEILQNGLRKLAVDIIKTTAAGDDDKAARLTRQYQEQLDMEIQNAEDAIRITRGMLSGTGPAGASPDRHYTKREAADFLHITADTLRNWERNGLLAVRRGENGYRYYTAGDLRRMQIIRSLRCANYSLSSILRMLHTLSADPAADLRAAIDTPAAEEEIISVCDRLLTSLREAQENARFVAGQIDKIKKLRG